MRKLTSIGGSVLLACCLVANAKAASNDSSPVSSASASERCTALSQARTWPDGTTRILRATWHAADTKVTTPAQPGSRPAHCEIVGSLRERRGDAGQRYVIRFRMRLPDDWNQRFFFQGGGGTNGDIGEALGTIALGAPTALSRGYAVVTQDSGHDATLNSVSERGGPVAFGFDAQARADYGGTSLKPVADAAKAVIATYYGRPPDRSYFVGCSKGGQEGMAFAQRHPDEFDGIVAGAPGFSLPRAAIAEAWDTQAFASLIDRSGKAAPRASQLSSTFSDVQFASVRGAVLAACDADDGARDGITSNWPACDWPRVQRELRKRVCSGSPTCLSDAQVKVIERVYSGAKDSKGNALYSSWAFDGGVGSEAWRAWKIGLDRAPFPGINVAMGAPALAAVFTTPPTAVAEDLDAAFEFALKFDFDRDAPKIHATGGSFVRSAWDDISARSTDLSAFRKRGAKMIVPHGVSDPVFSVNDTVAWYRDVNRLNKNKASDFVRVFPVPGMAHCAGGPATDQFNAFDALVEWVERGKAPDQIIATAGPMSPWPGRTRPLCAYPKVARFSGNGSIEDANQFRCE